ncbi:MAG TPA: cyanophycin synthetase [Pseudobacteroides sp.]|uniref:cyanophycin synthetase n=1 Tax=Pseudobacteroides sp. TaxID=1968840 RepID=UPI002F936933
MEIEDIRVFNAPNIYSLREPIVRLQIKLGELADIPTKDIGNINEKIVDLFPGIKEHKCCTGYVGGFVDRLKEGTYLAHVTEHLCLETLRILGYDIKHGKARQVKDDIYHVIFTCPHTTIGKACGLFIIDTLRNLIDGKTVNMETEIEKLKKLCVRYDIGISTGAVISEANKRGIPVSLVNDGDIVRLGYGKYQKRLSATLYEGTSSISVDAACNKHLTKTLLEEAAIPVPKGKSVLDLEEAKAAANSIGYPVVVKPQNGNKGKFIFVNIKNEIELEEAYLQAVNFDGECIVEKYIEGRDYRVLVVNGKVVAGAERIPAHIIGDGQHSISELIDIENLNELRGEDHEKPLTRLKVDDIMKVVLDKQDLTLSHIPEKGQKVWLRDNGNLSTGGEAYDCTDMIHPENIKIFEEAAKVIGIDIAGIDVVTPDISKILTTDIGAIVEVNAAPGIRMHLNPTGGKKRDVASPILDMMFPEGTPFTIPIVSITGTNGKTTTTRMISSILRHQGLTVGTTTTHGIYVNETCIEEGDTTGPKSAGKILHNRRVEAAVLETARGGIVKNGLAYDKADVAVFTNLTEDHLGVDGINTMEELLHAKSLVIEAVKEDGACVLNADDPWVMKAKDRAKGKQILFSMEYENPILQEHIANGGSAVYKKNNFIYIVCKGLTCKFISLSQIPATLDGGLKHNIYNSMAAIGASFALGVSFDIIKEALSEFSCDANSNPGRFNIYDLGDFKVVLDYGHNIDGYRVTIDGLHALKPSRLVGVIGVPGDRLDTDIFNVGKIAGSAFDYIFIKEDQDLRERQPLEVADLLYRGASSGSSKDCIKIIPDEAEALRLALLQARKGDVIAVFFEKMEPLVEVINEYQESISMSQQHAQPIPV